MREKPGTRHGGADARARRDHEKSVRGPHQHLERHRAHRAAVVVWLALVLGGVGCQDAGERRAHLTIGTFWSGAATQALHRELIRIAQDLGSVNIDVRLFSDVALNDYLSKNQPQGAQESLDLAVVPSEWLGQLAQREVIGELPAARVEELRRKLVGQSLLAVSDAGQVLGFPISAEVLALVYDPTVFPYSPRTVEDLLSAHLAADVVPFALDLANPAYLAPFVSSLQGSLLDRDGNFLWRDEAVAETLGRLAPAWKTSGGWRACRGDDLESLQVQLFAEGKLASFVAGPWLLRALEDGGRPFRVIPIPRLAGAPHPARALVGYQCVVVARGSRWADLALEVAARLLDPEADQRINRATRRLPVLLSAYESKQGVASGGTFGFLRALEEAQFLPAAAHWSEGFQRAEERLRGMSNSAQPPRPEEIRLRFTGGRS